MISNSGKDENGRYSGGKAGDQTGNEWSIINWYNRPWQCVLRHPDAAVREKIASLAEKAARNNKIGYDQNERTSYWYALKNANYDPSKITTACEGDCSAGVMANVKATGYLLGIDKLKNVTITSTHYMRNMLKNAGFEVLTESKYLTSDRYLLRGDILLNDGAHTATNLTNGSNASTSGNNGTSGTTSSGSSFQSSVRDFQKWLNKTYPNTIKNNCGALLVEDNDFGSKTRAAALCVWKYEMNKLKVGYTFDLKNSNFFATCKKYGNKAVVKKGSRGAFVYLAQGMLRAKGYYTGELDGDAGSLTDSAIRKYQKAKGLSVDGSCGANTWYSLFN